MLSLSLSENKRAQRERESLVGEKATFRDAQRFADDVSKSSASLSLSCYVSINLKRKPPLCFGGKSSDICLFVCLRDV